MYELELGLRWRIIGTIDLYGLPFTQTGRVIHVFLFTIK